MKGSIKGVLECYFGSVFFSGLTDIIEFQHESKSSSEACALRSLKRQLCKNGHGVAFSEDLRVNSLGLVGLVRLI